MSELNQITLIAPVSVTNSDGRTREILSGKRISDRFDCWYRHRDIAKWCARSKHREQHGDRHGYAL